MQGVADSVACKLQGLSRPRQGGRGEISEDNAAARPEGLPIKRPGGVARQHTGFIGLTPWPTAPNGAGFPPFKGGPIPETTHHRSRDQRKTATPVPLP